MNSTSSSYIWVGMWKSKRAIDNIVKFETQVDKKKMSPEWPAD